MALCNSSVLLFFDPSGASHLGGALFLIVLVVHLLDLGELVHIPHDLGIVFHCVAMFHHASGLTHTAFHFSLRPLGLAAQWASGSTGAQYHHDALRPGPCQR